MAIRVTLQQNANSWYAYWRDDSGKHRECVGSKATMSKTEARRQCDEKAAEFARAGGAVRPDEVPMLLDAFDDHVARRELTHADKTVEMLRRTRVFLAEHFPSPIRMDKITEGDAADFLSAIRAKHALRATSACVYVRILKAFWTDTVGRSTKAVRMSLAYSPWGKLKSTAPTRTRPSAPVTGQDIQRLCAAMPTPQWMALFAMCSLAGLRRSEAMKVRWQDVLYAQNQLFVAFPKRKLAEDIEQRQRHALMCPELAAILRSVQVRSVGSEGPCHGLHNSTVNREARAMLILAGFAPWPDPLQALRRWRVGTWKQIYPEANVNEWCGHTRAVSEKNYFNVPTPVFGMEAEIARLKDELAKAQKGSAPVSFNETHGRQPSD